MSTGALLLRRVVLWMIILVGFGVVFRLSKGAWDLLQVKDRVDMAAEEVEELERKHKELKQTYEQQTSEAFAEKTIREKLNMAKPGEVVVVVPLENQESMTVGAPRIDTEAAVPVWKQWLALVTGE